LWKYGEYATCSIGLEGMDAPGCRHHEPPN